jgi:hypothetical protein
MYVALVLNYLGFIKHLVLLVLLLELLLLGLFSLAEGLASCG